MSRRESNSRRALEKAESWRTSTHGTRRAEGRQLIGNDPNR
jgi:hypothetical protein